MSLIAPGLLVSVRSSEEAAAALWGGADIVDVKEPLNGALGCAAPEIIRAVARTIDQFCDSSAPQMSAGPALSLALGEVSDWTGCVGDAIEEYRSLIQQVRPAYLKLGLAGLCPEGSTSEWVSVWQSVRDCFAPEDGHRSDWVAVAYADHLRAGSPAVRSVCDAAVLTSCRVLLIDTFVKDATTLLDWLSPGELGEVRYLTSRAGLKLALAGRVTSELIPLLQPYGFDIVGVRGAVCEFGERRSTVQLEKVQHLRTLLKQHASDGTLPLPS